MNTDPHIVLPGWLQAHGVTLGAGGTLASVFANAGLEFGVPAVRDAPPAVHFVLWGCSILVGLATAYVAIRRAIGESNSALKTKLEAVRAAVADVDNPTAGMAREVGILREEIKGLRDGNKKTLEIAGQLLHTHQERVSVDELSRDVQRNHGEMKALYEKLAKDVQVNIGDKVRDLVTHAKRMDEWKDKTDGRLDDLERKVGS